jgi:hypothetical protein
MMGATFAGDQSCERTYSGVTPAREDSRIQSSTSLGYPQQSIEQDHVLAFLKALRRHLRGPVVLLWDRLTAHRGGRVQEYLAGWPSLHQEYLPAYAPELNPIEYLWSWLKRSDPLANSCPQTVEEITSTVCQGIESVPANQSLLHGCIRATKLPLKLHLPARHCLGRAQ